jgi:hypothetical protein
MSLNQHHQPHLNQVINNNNLSENKAIKEIKETKESTAVAVVLRNLHRRNSSQPKDSNIVYLIN